MGVETMDLGRLYDNVDADALGGGHLYDDGKPVRPKPDSLLYRDRITVIPMTAIETIYGSKTVQSGDPVYCWCSIEPRINKNSTFSKNWAQDTTPQSYGGLREDSMVIVLAPEWHGDINTVFWFENACYEVDGPPSYMRHSSDLAAHWNVTARCIGHVHERGITEQPVPPEGSHAWGM